MTDLLGDIGSAISGVVGDTVTEGIQAILYATIYKLLYYIAVGCCWIIDLLYGMFEVMAGLTKVSYNGEMGYLINVFFSNTTVSKVYWGMALIGMAVGFGFAIVAVIKKLFDISEKEKRTYGQIMGSLLKTILMIICMSLIISMVLNATTLLMQQVNFVFINADDLGEDETITFTDEEYATMARVLNTIGNFSLNPSYNNRFNLNKCFNEIRPDLQYLMQQGVFDFHYVTTDTDGNSIATWQSALQNIANSASLKYDLSLDVYHESVSNSLLETMELLRVNGSFRPLDEYRRQYVPSRASVPMDRLLFLMATMGAAKNSDYNVNPSLTDPLRGAYYYGEKSIYDLDTVNKDFDIGVAALDYVILFLTCFKLLGMLVTIILNCVSRIFNMLLLYLISPLVLGVAPLDDGAKTKQWTTAFVVQSLSVFGTVISMRVLLLFMPLVTNSDLVLFSNPVADLLGKLVIILGGFEVAQKATNLITGILADNAGWQSITAGDMSGVASKVTETGKAYATKYGKSALGLGLSAAGKVGKGGLMAVGGAALGAGYSVYGIGKGGYNLGKALAGKISSWRDQPKANNEQGAEPKKQVPGENPDAGFDPSADDVKMSPRIAAMAARVDAHNADSASSAQVQKSPRIARMAADVDAHNAGHTLNRSAKIAEMAARVDAHNADGATSAQVQKSSRIAEMAARVDAHNADGATSAQVQKSSRIARMAAKVDAHNADSATSARVQKSPVIASMAAAADDHRSSGDARQAKTPPKSVARNQKPE